MNENLKKALKVLRPEWDMKDWNTILKDHRTEISHIINQTVVCYLEYKLNHEQANENDGDGESS